MRPRIGMTYRIKHQRKGEIVGKMLGRVKGDEADKTLWLIDIAGTGERLIRPTLVESMERANG